MKTEPSTLVNILKASFLRKAKNPTIDPVAIDFGEKEIKISQMDNSNVLLLLHTYSTSIFKDYKPFSVKKISNDVLDFLSDSFKTDETIDLNFTDDTMIIEGLKERLKYRLSTADAETYDGEVEEVKANEKKIGLVPTNLAKLIKSSYLIDISELTAPILTVGDTIVFDYKEKELSATVTSPDGSAVFNKRIEFSDSDFKEEGKITISTDLLKRIIDVLNGKIWITFTKEPIIISQVDDKKTLTYVMAAIVEE
jgi:hypothetical protein